MSLDEVCAIPVADVAAPRSILALWAPWLMAVGFSSKDDPMPPATRVCRSWGFEPFCGVPWIKGRWRNGGGPETLQEAARAVVAASESGGVSSLAESVERLSSALGEPRGDESDLVVQIAGGNYVRTCSEVLILAKSASFSIPTQSRPRAVLFDPLEGLGILASRPGGHSRKPRTAHELLETMYPEGRLLEMFARPTERRPRWSYWGNESDGSTSVSAILGA